jgi:hypothetical protein
MKNMEIEKKVCTGCGEHKEETFAMQICRELKSKVAKWRFVACVEFALLVSIVIGYILKG